jgi:hypothetical protein
MDCRETNQRRATNCRTNRAGRAHSRPAMTTRWEYDAHSHGGCTWSASPPGWLRTSSGLPPCGFSTPAAPQKRCRRPVRPGRWRTESGNSYGAKLLELCESQRYIAAASGLAGFSLRISPLPAGSRRHIKDGENLVWFEISTDFSILTGETLEPSHHLPAYSLSGIQPHGVAGRTPDSRDEHREPIPP